MSLSMGETLGKIATSALAGPYRESRAEEFGLNEAQFAEILEQLAPVGEGNSSRTESFTHPHLGDVVLARACAAGSERGWEVFMLRFREKLYDAARQITRDDASGRELADSVYTDLYGTETREGRRVSKLTFYSGRGSLEGWLRTVMAQQFVNAYRKQRRVVSLDEESECGAQFAAPAEDEARRLDPRLEQTLDQVLRSLSAEERFVLASYFLDGRTLAEIALALSVHESTISRRIEKLTRSIRKQVLKQLVQQGMSRRQAEEALGADVRDLALDIRASLAQDSMAGAFSRKGAKAGEGS
jgi:RNA polymerase sigma-70 factor (ECF subfamily)